MTLETVLDTPFNKHMSPQEAGDLGRRKLAAQKYLPVLRELLFPAD